MICEKNAEAIAGVDIEFHKENNCVVSWALKLLEAVFAQTCGKTVFCREGTLQMRKIIKDISEGRGHSEDLDIIIELCKAIKEMADCELSKKAAMSILNSIDEYKDEWDAHIVRKRCPGLICSRLVTFHILGEKCSGCMQCLDKCPEQAISGAKDMIHVIDQDQCSRCGICIDICSNVCGAIVKAGGVKPKTPDSPIPVGTWQAKGLGGLRKGLRK
ncbi:NADH-quinone oxidoreductase subunit F [Anaerobacterium chartisolvens]|uniref:NADH-quinone oxidoreductase subunit F n=1 Tax=Anaerobacterium chartisolvens TaxID=1297424 RepID=A0A369B8M9_9FIRM|nr:NADH-ubiquinone oxidoreductase-F iron-sulfur binding region domain-containing protein [Anaerobacterium chartisolvens]RCX16024.1 NADH-quinone oxidoreductase subunit F [Anaerobacterium chartisolvens]